MNFNTTKYPDVLIQGLTRTFQEHVISSYSVQIVPKRKCWELSEAIVAVMWYFSMRRHGRGSERGESATQHTEFEFGARQRRKRRTALQKSS